MIQRFLYTALNNGLTEIQNDEKILEYLFEDLYSMERSERRVIQETFVNNSPKVVHGYLPKDVEMPAISIVMASESEKEHILGDDAGIIDDSEDPDFGSDIFSAIWESTFHVHCYSEHPDVTQYIYEAVKNIILVQGTYFDSEGMFEIHVSGMDLIPDPRYIPEHLFVRQLSFSCQREFMRVDRLARLQKAFAVRGIHVDRSGSPSDVGDVKTLVTPYGVDDG